jgi:signal recognition particle GTPase
VLLVVDSLTGRTRSTSRRASPSEVPLTGVVLTRMDGDARGGAALSMRAVTGKPIKFAGTGEKLDAIECSIPAASPAASSAWAMSSASSRRPPRRSRKEDAEKLAAAHGQGQFDMNDLRMQLRQMQKMGGLGMLAGMMPGMKRGQGGDGQSGMDDKVLVHMEAIIGSMTPKERARPELLNAKRKIRVAAARAPGAGRQQAAQDAPGNGPRDEADQEDGRAQGPGRHVRQGRNGRRCPDGRAWAAVPAAASRPGRRWPCPVLAAARTFKFSQEKVISLIQFLER